MITVYYKTETLTIFAEVADEFGLNDGDIITDENTYRSVLVRNNQFRNNSNFLKI